jgi:hypothetical protein
MTTAVIETETEDLVSAARRLELWAADPLAAATSRLGRVLTGSGGMAGSDPGAMSWAGGYDPAAGAAAYASQQAINSVHKLAGMFAQSARNYAAAEAASTASARRVTDEALHSLPRPGTYLLPACVPSAGGGSGGEPPGWGLIASAVGRVWPNGHQDGLRTAAGAWRDSGAELEHAAGVVIDSCGPAIGHRIPESADMWQVCAALAGQLRRLGEVHAALADACEQYAHHLDRAHHEVIVELQSLLGWTAAIEAGAAVLSLVTFGASEAVGQGAEAARVAATAARVAAIIDRFTALAGELARDIAVLAERADRVAGALNGLLDTRLSVAVVEQVRALPAVLSLQELAAARRLGALGGALPELSVTVTQLERKFKHAKVLGVALGRGRAGFQAFDAALRRFLADPSTRRVLGSYRDRPAILSYQVRSRVVVVQDLDGRFVSTWRLRHRQIIHVVNDRRLGGG